MSVTKSVGVSWPRTKLAFLMRGAADAKKKSEEYYDKT